MEKVDENILRTMDSISRIEREEPSIDLMGRLRNIPNEVRKSYDVIPKKIVWSGAASILVLIMLNVFSVFEYAESKKVERPQTESYFDYLIEL